MRSFHDDRGVTSTLAITKPGLGTVAACHALINNERQRITESLRNIEEAARCMAKAAAEAAEEMGR